MYFDYISMFEAPYHKTLFKGMAQAHFEVA